MEELFGEEEIKLGKRGKSLLGGLLGTGTLALATFTWLDIYDMQIGPMTLIGYIALAVCFAYGLSTGKIRSTLWFSVFMILLLAGVHAWFIKVEVPIISWLPYIGPAAESLARAGDFIGRAIGFVLPCIGGGVAGALVGKIFR